MSVFIYVEVSVGRGQETRKGPWEGEIDVKGRGMEDGGASMI